MIKLVLLVLVLCCSLVTVAQKHAASGSPNAFERGFDLLQSHGYKVAFPVDLKKNFPPVVLKWYADVPIDTVLNRWLSGLKVKYLITDKNILFYLTEDAVKKASLFADLVGFVYNRQLQPIPGATVVIAGSSRAAVTDNTGYFRLPVSDFDTKVIVTSVGYLEHVGFLSNKQTHLIILEVAPQGLDAVVVVPFGANSKRINTGSVYTVSDFSSLKTPGGNVLDAIEGTVPGVFVTSANGVAGGARPINIGGTHSLLQNNDPLYIVNGVPLTRDGFLNPIGSVTAQGPAGASPLNFIAPDNIESVTFLKDADATSIYGSRAANGVVLITLKSGKAGPLRLSFDISGGFQKAVKTSPLLNTAQFLAMRQEAVSNDGGTDSVPEMAWGARQTDFRRLTIGGRGAVVNSGLQAQWGTDRSGFFLSGQLHSESTVFPGQTRDDRRSLYGNWHGRSEDGRWKADITGLYSWEGNHLPTVDYTAYRWLAPNAPPFKNPDGSDNWGVAPLSFVNIPALANNDYRGDVRTSLAHLHLSYRLDNHISFEENLGYNGIRTNERANLRWAGQDSNNTVGGQVTTAKGTYTHLMTETIGRWIGKLGPGRLEGLAGIDLQFRNDNYSNLQLSYASDADLDAGKDGTTPAYTSDSIPYRYSALFGRINYDVARKYILSASWRGDKSRVLGAQEPVGNFWTVGGAWVFSREHWFDSSKILSFGKLRGSLGTTGNEPREDLILNEAASIAFVRGLPQRPPNLVIPTSLPLHWELNYREELAIELGFFHDKLLFSAAANRGWTANQLINASPIAGTMSIPKLLYSEQGINIENRALEFQLQLNSILLGKLGLTSTFVLTIPRNRIVHWPGLAKSGYANIFVEGKSITVTKRYHLERVDPDSGLYVFQTTDPTGNPQDGDQVPNAGLDPKYYAGWSQRITLGNWELDWVVDYRRQRGSNPLVLLAQQNAPGVQGPQQLSNGPVEWLDHWRTKGDIASQQRLTAGGDPIAWQRLQDYINSDALSIDASYLRLRSITLGWRLPPRLAKRLGLREGRIAISGQNLWTRTHFPVTDPETQDPTVLPPMKILVAGIHVAF